MSEIIVSSGTTRITTVDASNTYFVESSGTLGILNGGLVSGLITVGEGGTLIVSLYRAGPRHHDHQWRH